jgi:hypothetical protein
MHRDNMFICYTSSPLTKHASSNYFLKPFLKRLQDQGDFKVPSMLWAPLGRHDASETEVLLVSLFVLLELKGNPEDIATFSCDARQADEELAKWTSSGKCASGFALQMALSIEIVIIPKSGHL